MLDYSRFAGRYLPQMGGSLPRIVWMALSQGVGEGSERRAVLLDESDGSPVLEDRSIRHTTILSYESVPRVN